jgi:hypothetical protein
LGFFKTKLLPRIIRDHPSCEELEREDDLCEEGSLFGGRQGQGVQCHSALCQC